MGEIQQGINQAISNVGIMAALNPTVKKWGETREIGKQQKNIKKALSEAEAQEAEAWIRTDEAYQEADKRLSESPGKTAKQKAENLKAAAEAKEAAINEYDIESKPAQLLRERGKELSLQRFEKTGKYSDLKEYTRQAYGQDILTEGMGGGFGERLAYSKELAEKANERWQKQNAARREQYARIKSAVNKQMYESGAYKLGKEQQKIVRAELTKDAKEKDKWLNK